MATQYLTNAEYRSQKSRLTRAKNTGDPLRVLAECERVLKAWEGKAWPDDWHRWSVALYDAWHAYERQDEVNATHCIRFSKAYGQFG